MSFPSRQPIGMPPMGPGMMHQSGYTFAPMGMMPMGMGMMAPPPMMRPIVASSSSSNQNSVKSSKKLVPQEIPKDDKKDEKPPVTTVFIGNISDRAPDMMIKQMLQRCGNVLSWKRVQGASGKLQAFGFCEYEDPEATLRCIRLLNEWNIADKKLVVKVDAKTKTLLDEYRAKKKAKDASSENGDDKQSNGEKEGEEETKPLEDDDELDEDGKREDRVARAGLEAIMREYTFELSKPSYSEQDKEPKERPKKKEDKGIIADTGLDDMELEEDKLQIINREIQSFRDLHKDEEEDADATERERRSEDKQRRRERERMREKERERMREREKALREKTRSRSRSPSPRRSRRRSRSRDRSRDRSRERRKERELEEEEEAYERRKLEKKLREKEAAYQERLKNWEARERKKSREYDKEKEREEERKAEEQREARRLKEFLEDYDDLRDDPKYFKGSALARRLKEREKEKEADSRDRQREKEEYEELRRKLMEEGHPDPDAELARLEKEREEHLQPRLHLQESEPSTPEKEVVKEELPPPPVVHNSDSDSKSKMQPTLKPVEVKASPPSNEASSSDEDTRGSFPSVNYSDDSQQPIISQATKDEPTKLGFSGLKLGSASPSEGSGTKRKKLTVGDVFNQDDEDSMDSKKRKLIPLDYDEEKGDKKPSTAEEKRQRIKHLIESIPTAKDELFNYKLDWNIVDQSLMDKRIKPWVNKKIIEYIGEEEPTLTDFICQKVVARSTPQSIQNDVAMVLDEEAEVFVVKMWRLLVYETEAKKLGLVK
ncbi:RNA-binding protein 25-like [Haliotis asinina]|uniref:RNA-binding protein 25-like n=1 Tax=Haliotis asinina TaxID=109174 RepID=UPI003531A63B